MIDQYKHVVAACISPFDSGKGNVPPNVLAGSFYAIARKAFNDSNLIDLLQRVECVLFVEGPKNSVSVGPLHIMRMPLEMIDQITDVYLSGPKGPEEKGNPNENVMICAIGSSIFCQDIVRFAAVDRDGQIDSATEEFTNSIMHATQGEVIWTDTSTEEAFHTGNLVEMFMEAKRAGAIPG